MNDDFQLLQHYSDDWPEWGSAPRRPLIECDGAHKGELMDSVIGPDLMTREPMVHHVIRCELCILTHVWPLPNPEALAGYYTDQFYQLDKKEYVFRYEQDREWWEQCVHGPILSQCQQQLSLHHQANARFLEIGSGPGIALDVASNRFGWHATGMEPNADLCLSLRQRGHFFFHGTLEDYMKFRTKFPEAVETWDILYLYEVLEHQPNPESFLLDCYELLNPGGLIVVCVPQDYSVLQMEAQHKLNLKPYWLAPPQHLNYFTPKTLQLLLRRCGFQILDARGTYPLEQFLLDGRCYVGNYSLGRECHQERMKEELSDIASGKWAEREEVYRENLKKRIGREMIFIARKIK